MKSLKQLDLSPSIQMLLMRLAKAGPLPVRPVAVLIGLAAGWQWSGMRTILASAIDPLPATTTMLGAIVLLTTAVGPWLPERIIHWIAHIIGRRSRQADMPVADGTGTFWMLRAIRDRDESLMWLVLALLASLAGAVSLTMASFQPQLWTSQESEAP